MTFLIIELQIFKRGQLSHCLEFCSPGQTYKTSLHSLKEIT